MTNRVLSVDELTERSFDSLYDHLEENWGTALANATLGVDSMEVVYRGDIDQLQQMQMPASTSGYVPEEEGMCALCLHPIDEDKLPAPNHPFGICKPCREKFDDYLTGDD